MSLHDEPSLRDQRVEIDVREELGRGVVAAMQLFAAQVQTEGFGRLLEVTTLGPLEHHVPRSWVARAAWARHLSGELREELERDITRRYRPRMGKMVRTADLLADAAGILAGDMRAPGMHPRQLLVEILLALAAGATAPSWQKPW